MNIINPQVESTRAISPLGLLIRLVGIGVMLAGLYCAFEIFSKAWALLEHAETIVPFADEIEKQSHLNSYANQMGVVVDFIKKAKAGLPGGGVNQADQYVKNAAAALPDVPANFNASYFAAWGITLLVLGLLARISLRAISEGGKLALYSIDDERQFKNLVRRISIDPRK